jgi:putative DNA primase/helicase
LRDLAEVREIATFGIGKIFRDEANTADLIDISMRVYRALALEPDGPVGRAALIQAGVTVDDLRLAYGLEWRRKQDLQVHPGMPLAQVRSAVARVTTINKRVGNLARFWKLLANTIETDADRSPWLSIRQRTPSGESGEYAPAVNMAWRDDVHETWTAPSLVMDATMSPEIVAVFFPTAEIAPRIGAPMPHARVTQIVDRAMTADMLIPIGDSDEHPNPTRRANVERLRRFISFRATNFHPGRVLVVCQQGLEAALLSGPLPDTVEIAHFNAITGLNAWKDVTAVIVIGRSEPAVRDVERIAKVLFGAPVQEIEPDDEGHVRYPRTRRGIRMRDGRGIAVDGPEHPDPRVEAVRRAICEGELIQAIGRGRGVNRTAANPLEIDILTNVCLWIEVDKVTTWKEIQPDVIDVMWATGAIPGSYGDMADAYPDLFPSRDAAKMAIRRTNQEQTSIEDILYRRMFRVSAVGYRRKRSRGPAGRLFYDADRIDPLVWLTARFGDCSLTPASTAVEQTTDLAAVSIAAIPVFECDDDLEERLAIMTIDAGMTEADARSALGLPLVLPSFYAIVDEVTGGGYPGPEDWLLATSVWVERCQSLQCSGEPPRYQIASLVQSIRRVWRP